MAESSAKTTVKRISDRNEMSNTIRSEAELLALFIDNNQGLINAQDMRDFVVSCRIGQIYPGAQGSQGIPGTPGSQGSQGRAGPQGAQGTASSVQGPLGFQGYQGTGFQGYQGTGSQGPQGFQGTSSGGGSGSQGLQGSVGPQGFQGTSSGGGSGSQGSQGLQGSSGLQGNQGHVGNQGSQGNQGSVGSVGFQGNQGSVGSVGFQGNQGSVGLQGNQGSVGSQGNQGSVGLQGLQGNAAVDLFTNATPTPTTIGGIVAGSTFSNDTMQQMWNLLLYPYQSPAFSSFSISGQSTSIEVGITISGTKTFVWGTTNSGNVQTNSIIIRDVTNSVVLATGVANTGSNAIALPSSIQKTSPGSNQWSIQGTNTNSINFSTTFTVSWFWLRYYGTSTNSSLTASQIAALSNSGLASSFSGTFAYAGGGYKFYCFPDSFGSPSTFKDSSTNLNVAMASSIDDAFFSNTANSLSYGLVSVTNVNSQTTNYRVYRSKNILGGSISIIVA